MSDWASWGIEVLSSNTWWISNNDFKRVHIFSGYKVKSSQFYDKLNS